MSRAYNVRRVSLCARRFFMCKRTTRTHCAGSQRAPQTRQQAHSPTQEGDSQTPPGQRMPKRRRIFAGQRAMALLTNVRRRWSQNSAREANREGQNAGEYPHGASPQRVARVKMLTKHSLPKTQGVASSPKPFTMWREGPKLLPHASVFR